MIRKYKKAENKKNVYITLTKEGVRAYKNHEKFHDGFNKKITAYLSSLSKKEFSAIVRLAELVNENIPDFDKTEDIV